jgi:hypothetical protein
MCIVKSPFILVYTKKMKLMKIILYSLAIIAFCTGIYLWVQSYLQSNPTILSGSTLSSVQFLSKEETQNVLNEDADHYYNRFQEHDLLVRGVKTKDEYLAKIANSACEVDPEIQEKIEDCIERLHARMETMEQEEIEGILIAKLKTLPWKLGFTCDKEYENGLPHTRGDVILLNNKDVKSRTITETCRLLLHEQTHVYQKTVDMKKYLEENYDTLTLSKEEVQKLPANPDTDGKAYVHKTSGEKYLGQYSKKPKHFRDIQYSSDDGVKKEHPYEYAAYKMETLYE